MLVVSANLWNINPMQEQAIRNCIGLDPDVIVLQELKNSYVEKTQKVFAANGYALAFTQVNRVMSLAIATRLPVGQCYVINQGPFAKRPQIRMALEMGISIVGVHLDAPLTRKRIEKRSQQLTHLAQIIHGLETPVVLAGDFNTYYAETAFQKFLVAADCAQSYQHTPERTRTWPSIWPIFHIDHILCTPQLRVHHFSTESFNGSDHRPISAYVDLAADQSH